MLNFSTRLIALITLIARCSFAYGQLYNFTNYSIDQGLPQSTVFCIHEDNQGYLWLGTESGVARFDGNYFKTYDQGSGLPGNIVRSIISTPDGFIWVATDKGLAVFDGFSWKTVSEKDGLTGTAFTKLACDNKNRIWAATNDAGVNIISLSDTLRIDHLASGNGLAGNFILDIYCETNRTWVAGIGGVNMIYERQGSFDVFNLADSVSLPSLYFTSIDKDDAGNFWFGTLDAGAIRIATKNKLYSIHHYEASKGITDPRIWDVRCFDKQVYLASNDNGFYQVKNGQTVNISIENSLPGNQVLTVFRDSKRNIWLGSMGSGLTLWRGETLMHYTREQGLPGQKILAIHGDGNGKLWVGSDEKGLALVRFIDKKLHAQYFTSQSGFKSNQVTGIGIGQDNQLILGTWGDGIARLVNGRFYYLTKADGLVHDQINGIYCSPSGSVYAATSLGFNEIKSDRIHTIAEDDGLINSEVQTIISDLEGNIWMGTMGGLARFSEKTNQYRDFDQQEGLFDLRIHCLAADKFNNIWIGTNNGLYTYFVADDTIKRVTSFKTGSKLIQSLLFFNDTTLITGTALGFDKIVFDASLKQIWRQVNYDKQNGFRFSENNLNAIYKDEQNHVWFGTVNGLTLYQPELEDTITDVPQVYISGIRLSFGVVDWKDLGYPINNQSHLPENLSLSHQKNHITFDYNGFYLRNPEKVQFRYKLEPIESTWSPVTKNTSVPYPGLNNGTYTFSIIATCDGVHWSKPVVYSFEIQPPFWKTIWFYLVVLAFIAIALVIYIRWRERKLLKEKAHLEQIVKERTAEVVAQKEEIEKQKEEITSSITYARRIQRAVLPGFEVLQQNTSDSFILFKPRDIVSGDFYWMGRVNNHLLVTAADCTGHGVPGAFMSMLGVSFLNKIVNELKIELPDQILNQMRHNVITSMKQGGHEGSTKDGMDMALCAVNLDTMILTFAGAYNPAIIISNNQAIELKADRMPVAHHIVMNPFSSEEIQLQPGDCVYVFSDGYQDQIGGPDERKFMRKNLRELLLNIHQKPMCEQQQILDETIENWRKHPSQPKGETHQMDDILVVGFRV